MGLIAPDDFMTPQSPVELEEDKRKKIRSPADLVSLVADPDEQDKLNNFSARANVVGHHDTKPDDYAKSLTVAKNAKVHPDLVHVDRDAWEKQQTDITNGLFIVGNKELRDWINKDPANVQTSRDDIVNLDRATRYEKEAWQTNPATNPYMTKALNMTGIPSFIGELSDASADFQAAYKGHYYGLAAYEYQFGSPERRAQLLPQLLAYEAEVKERKESGAYWLTRTFAEFTGGMAAATPGAIPYGVAGVMTGGAIGGIMSGPAAPVGAALGSLGLGSAGLITGFSIQSGTATSGSIYRELDLMRDQYGQEIPEDVKQVLAFTGGLIVGTFEAAGGRLIKSAVADFMKKMATTAAVRESIAQNMISLARYGKKGAVINLSQTFFEEMSKQVAMQIQNKDVKSFETVFNNPEERGKLFDKLLESGAKGAVVGGTLGSVALIPSRGPPKMDQLQVLANQNRLDQTLAIAQESQQRTRNPEAYADLVDSTHKESLSLPPELVIANKEAFRFIPDLDQQLERAAKSGTDITTTIGQYAAHMATPEGQKVHALVRDHVALGDGVKTAAEINEQLQAQKALDEQAKAAAGEAPPGPTLPPQQLEIPGLGPVTTPAVALPTAADVAQTGLVQRLFTQRAEAPSIEVGIQANNELRIRAGISKPPLPPPTPENQLEFSLAPPQPHVFPPTPERIALGPVSMEATLIKKKLSDADEAVRRRAMPKAETEAIFLAEFRAQQRINKTVDERILELAIQRAPRTMEEFHKFIDEEAVRMAQAQRAEAIGQVTAEAAARPVVERIVGAAIKVGDRVVEAPNHFDALDKAQKAGLSGIDDASRGFVTSTGRYVLREEASAIAEKAEQADKTQGVLMAEDLPATGLGELGGAAGAISENLNRMLWKKAQAGEVIETRGGKPTAVLQGAKLAREHGGLQNETSFREYVQEQARIPQGEGFNAAMRALVKKYVDRAKLEAQADDAAQRFSNELNKAEAAADQAGKPKDDPDRYIEFLSPEGKAALRENTKLVEKLEEQQLTSNYERLLAMLPPGFTATRERFPQGGSPEWKELQGERNDRQIYVHDKDGNLVGAVSGTHLFDADIKAGWFAKLVKTGKAEPVSERALKAAREAGGVPEGVTDLGFERVRPELEAVAGAIQAEGARPSGEVIPIPPKVTENLANIHSTADAAHTAWNTRFMAEEGAKVIEDLSDKDAQNAAIQTGAAIEKRRKVMWLDPLFESPKAIGVLIKDFANYSKHIQEVQRRLTQAVWDAAHSVIKQKETKRWKDLGSEIAPEVADAVARRPEIFISSYLRTGRVQFETEGPLPKVKLSAADVDQLFAREELAEMGIKEGDNVSDHLPGNMFSKDKKVQVSADDLATTFQQGSGRYLIRMLIEAETKMAQAGERHAQRYTRLVREGINERLTKEHGDLNEIIMKESVQAVMNVAQLEVLTDELKMLAKGGRIDNDMIRKAVVEDMGKWTLEDATNVDRYQGQVGKYGQKAESALNAGDPVTAFKMKQHQIFAYIRAQNAVEIRRQQAETFQIVRKYADRPRVESVDEQYNARILQFMEMVGIRLGRSRELADIKADVKALTGPASLNEWIALQQNQIGEIISQPTFLLDMGRNVAEFKELTVNEFQQFSRVLSELDTVGSDKQFVTVAGERIFKEVMIDQMTENLSDRLRPEHYRTDVQQGLFKGVFRSLDAELIKIETLLTWLDKNDPDGPMTKYFFRPFKEAQARSEAMQAEFKARIKAALPHDLDLKKLTENTLLRDEYGGLMPLRRREMFNIAGLFFGTEATRKHLLDSHGWTALDVEHFLLTNMKTVDDWNHLESIHSIYNDISAEKSVVYRRLRGYGMEPPEPIIYADRYGKQRTGGYWASTATDSDQYRPVASDVLDRRNHNPLPSETLMIEQMKGIKKPSLNFEWLSYLIDQEIHDIAYRPAVVNAQRMLEDGKVLQLVKDAYGAEYSKLITHWVKDMANDRGWRDEVIAGFWTKVMRYVGSAVITHLVGFSPATAVIHSSSAAANTVAELHKKSIRASYDVIGDKLLKTSDWMFRNPRNLENATNFAWDNSPELRTRWIKDANNLRMALGHYSKRELAQWHYQRWAQSFVSYTDYMTAVVAWHGQYHTAVAEQGRTHEDAVFLADRLVRAAHGGIAQLDKSAIQRSTQLAPFTMFYGYFNHNYNQARRFGKHVQEGWAESKQNFYDEEYRKIYDRMSGSFWPGMLYMAGYVIVPALIHSAVRDKKDFDDEDWSIGSFLGASAISQIAGGIPVFRDMVYSALHPEYPANLPATQFWGSAAGAIRGMKKISEGEMPKIGSELLILPAFAMKFSSKYLERHLDTLTEADPYVPQNVREWKNMVLYGQHTLPGVKRKKPKRPDIQR